MSELTAPEANRLLYADHAAIYDETEHCIAKGQMRELLDGILGRALDASGEERPLVLDACGGTGNVSELLGRRGITTTVADVSPEMLARWRAKAERLGLVTETQEAEIEPFLRDDPREWDLIIFSSALHHLDDYVAVARLAGSRLAAGGVFVSAFDPVPAGGRWTLFLRRLDYLLSLALHPAHLLAALRRRRDRHGPAGAEHVNYGARAELHAMEGVSDEAIIAALRDDGLEIVEHRRYAMPRYRLTRWLYELTRRPTTFHLIAQRTAAGGEEAAGLAGAAAAR